MTAQISFNAFTGWVDATDPLNIPANLRLISASDLLRYENFGAAARDKINELVVLVDNHTTDLQEVTTTANDNATTLTQVTTDITSLKQSRTTMTDDITNLKAALPVATKTVNYTIVPADGLILANGASITVTLPSAVTSAAGKQFIVKNLNASTLTVASTAGTIDGASTKTLAQNASARFVSDGTNWFAV